MFDPRFLDEMAKRFAEALPPGVRQLQLDMERNFHAALQAAFSRMDLVTREEFDVQQEVLARTRAKLQELEKQVAELETNLAALRAVGKVTSANRTTTRKAADQKEG